mgnify:CR=1 FL=1
MKITIELDDEVLRKAVNAQVSETLAAYTGKVLEERAAEIIGTKLSRFSVEEFVGKRIDGEVRKAVNEALDNAIGAYAESRKAKITALVKEAIAMRVQEALVNAVGGGASKS